MTRDFPASDFQAAVGKRITQIEQAPDADEGLLIHLDDGMILDVGFSGCEGSIFLRRRTMDEIAQDGA